MRNRRRLAAVLAAGLLLVGASACDETTEGTDAPADGGLDAGEGATPEGGVGEEGVEDEGPIDG